MNTPTLLTRMRVLLPALCLLLVALPARAAWDISQLMQAMSQLKSGHVNFSEKKYIAILDAPVSASGELYYRAPDFLEKRTLLPKPQLMQLDKDQLIVEQGQRKFQLRLSDRPEAIVFADSIRGTLAGNQALLEKNFTLRLNGTAEQWSLELTPIGARLTALVSRILISGMANQVRTIEYQEADGDRVVMNITSADANAAK